MMSKIKETTNEKRCLFSLLYEKKREKWGPKNVLQTHNRRSKKFRKMRLERAFNIKKDNDII